MDMEQAQAHIDNVDADSTAGRTSGGSPEMFPVDSWSVSSMPSTTSDDDLSAGRWKQVSHLIQVWWSRIGEDEVAAIEGKVSRLASLLQRRYGYTEYHADSQSIRWMREHRDEREVTK